LLTRSRRLGTAPHLVNKIDVESLQRNVLGVKFLPVREGGREGGREGMN
jgi:hypothetical protein